jgi:hypothetical protein
MKPLNAAVVRDSAFREDPHDLATLKNRFNGANGLARVPSFDWHSAKSPEYGVPGGIPVVPLVGDQVANVPGKNHANEPGVQEGRVVRRDKQWPFARDTVNVASKPETPIRSDGRAKSAIDMTEPHCVSVSCRRPRSTAS